MARLQRAGEEEAGCARESVERRAAEATATATEEAEKYLQWDTPPGGCGLDTLRRLLEGDSASKMKINLDAEDPQSSDDSNRASRHHGGRKWKTPRRVQRPADGHPHNSDPFFTCSDGEEQDRRHR